MPHEKKQLRSAASAAEIVAYVGVAVAWIVAQAPVEWKRLVGLDDAVAGAVDGGWVVRGDSQRRAQRRRSRKARRACRNEARAAARDMNGAFCLFCLITPAMPVLNGPFRLLQTLHDDRSSRRIHRDARHGQGIDAMLLGARRGLLGPRSAKNENEAKRQNLQRRRG